MSKKAYHTFALVVALMSSTLDSHATCEESLEACMTNATKIYYAELSAVCDKICIPFKSAESPNDYSGAYGDCQLNCMGVVGNECQQGFTTCQAMEAKKASH